MGRTETLPKFLEGSHSPRPGVGPALVRAERDVTEGMDRKWFRLELPPQDRLIGAAFVFAIFAIAHRELTGLPPVGVSMEDLAFFYTELLIFPVSARS